MASAACMNKEGVPVELKLAASFEAIMALLPMPVNTMRPLQSTMCPTASEKESSIQSDKDCSAEASKSSTSLASAIRFADGFKKKALGLAILVIQKTKLRKTTSSFFLSSRLCLIL